MTKEEILNNHLDVDGVWWRDETTSGQVFAAMDEYAKECMLWFKDWIDGHNADWEFGQCEYKCWENLGKEKVIDLYLESKNKK